VEELSRETASLRQKMDDLRASRTAALSIIRNQRAELSTETARVAMLEGKAGEVPGLRAALEAAQKDAEEQRAERKADMGAMQAADKALGSARRRIAELEEQNATLTEQVVEQAGRLAGAHKRSASAVQELQEAQASSMKLVRPQSLPSSQLSHLPTQPPHHTHRHGSPP
jgi:chromosome segregation ATPase